MITFVQYRTIMLNVCIRVQQLHRQSTHQIKVKVRYREEFSLMRKDQMNGGQPNGQSEIVVESVGKQW